MNRRHIVADSSESINRVVYHRHQDRRQTSEPQRMSQTVGHNGAVRRGNIH